MNARASLKNQASKTPYSYINIFSRRTMGVGIQKKEEYSYLPFGMPHGPTVKILSIKS